MKTVKLPVNTVYKLRPIFLDQNGRQMSVSNPITFNTDTPSVASIDANGNVTAVAAGVANVTAVSGSLTSGAVQITVYVPVLSALSL